MMENNYMTAQLFAEKYEKPMIDAFRKSCAQAESMEEEDIKSILGICLGLGIMYNSSLSNHKSLTHEWVEDIVECAVILSYLWNYSFSKEPHHDDTWIVSTIREAKQGKYGSKIPGTQIKVKVVVEDVEIPRITTPKREVNKIVTAKKYDKKPFKTYLALDGYSGHIKIGKSTNPSRRIRQMLTSNPSIELKYTSDHDVESILHSEYSHKRINREWFDLTKDEIGEICREYDFVEVG